MVNLVCTDSHTDTLPLSGTMATLEVSSSQVPAKVGFVFEDNLFPHLTKVLNGRIFLPKTIPW